MVGCATYLYQPLISLRLYTVYTVSTKLAYSNCGRQ